MSIAEIKSELAKFSSAELAEIEAAVRELKDAAEGKGTPLSEYFGCGRGMMTLLPGWDEPAPLEDWEALRDDTSP